MGLHSTEAGFQPAGATEASNRTVPGRHPGAEAQGIHEERRGLGEVRGKADLEELTKIISDPRLTRLAEALEAVNPKAVKSNSRMIEI
jgi:hypothetical protein